MVRAAAATRKHEPKRDERPDEQGNAHAREAEAFDERNLRSIMTRRAARPLIPSRGMRSGVPAGCP